MAHPATIERKRRCAVKILWKAPCSTAQTYWGHWRLPRKQLPGKQLPRKRLPRKQFPGKLLTGKRLPRKWLPGQFTSRKTTSRKMTSQKTTSQEMTSRFHMPISHHPCTADLYCHRTLVSLTQKIVDLTFPMKFIKCAISIISGRKRFNLIGICQVICMAISEWR